MGRSRKAKPPLTRAPIHTSMNELEIQGTDRSPYFLFPPKLIFTPPDPILDNLVDALRAAMVSPKTATLIRHAVERVHTIQGEVALRHIAGHVGRAYRVSIHDLLSPKRTQHLAFCRQVAMYLCLKLTKRRELAAFKVGDWRVSRTALDAWMVSKTVKHND